MSCRDEKTFDGILCEDCHCCNMWEGLLKDDWIRFKDDWYASFLHQRVRKDLYKEEMRYKVLGERYHNFVTINLPKEIGYVTGWNSDYKEKKVDPGLMLTKLKEWGYFSAPDKAVMEYHTKEGEHPHFHIISYKKRKIPNIVRDVSKKFKIKSNFVDVNNVPKRYDIHIDYVNGLKQDKKQEFLDKDKQWRKDNGIPDIIVF